MQRKSNVVSNVARDTHWKTRNGILLDVMIVNTDEHVAAQDHLGQGPRSGTRASGITPVEDLEANLQRHHRLGRLETMMMLNGSAKGIPTVGGGIKMQIGIGRVGVGERDIAKAFVERDAFQG